MRTKLSGRQQIAAFHSKPPPNILDFTEEVVLIYIPSKLETGTLVSVLRPGGQHKLDMSLVRRIAFALLYNTHRSLAFSRIAIILVQSVCLACDMAPVFLPPCPCPAYNALAMTCSRASVVSDSVKTLPPPFDPCVSPQQASADPVS